MPSPIKRKKSKLNKAKKLKEEGGEHWLTAERFRQPKTEARYGSSTLPSLEYHSGSAGEKQETKLLGHSGVTRRIEESKHEPSEQFIQQIWNDTDNDVKVWWQEPPLKLDVFEDFEGVNLDAKEREAYAKDVFHVPVPPKTKKEARQFLGPHESSGEWQFLSEREICVQYRSGPGALTLFVTDYSQAERVCVVMHSLPSVPTVIKVTEIIGKNAFDPDVGTTTRPLLKGWGRWEARPKHGIDHDITRRGGVKDCHVAQPHFGLAQYQSHYEKRLTVFFVICPTALVFMLYRGCGALQNSARRLQTPLMLM